jgi:hypothetical protein
MRTRLVVLMLLSTMLACDPVFSLRVQQVLWPVPATQCLDSALSASPHVAHAKRVSEAKGVTTYALTLTDSIAQDYRPSLEIALPTKSDPGLQTRVLYYWMMTSRLPAALEQRVAQRGAEVLEDLRRACAPSGAPDIDCRYGDKFGGSGECRAAHLTWR